MNSYKNSSQQNAFKSVMQEVKIQRYESKHQKSATFLNPKTSLKHSLTIGAPGSASNKPFMNPSQSQTFTNAGPSSPTGKKTKKIDFLEQLSMIEKDKFGDRCPKGFVKKALLGKGGIAIVWLAVVASYKKCGYNEDMGGVKVALK